MIAVIDRKIKELTAKGEYSRALELTESLGSTGENTITRYDLMLKLGKFKEVISQISQIDHSSYSDYTLFHLHLFKAFSHCQISETEQGMEELAKSRETLERYKVDLEMEKQQSVGVAEFKLGELYRILGQLEQAEDSLTSAVEIFSELGDDRFLATSRYQLLLTCIELGDRDCVQKIANQFEEDGTTDKPYISLLKKMSRAIELKQQGRIKSIYEAQQLFDEIIEDEVILGEITADAIFNRCDILVGELRNYGSVEVLEEINNYSRILIDLADTQKSSLLMAQGLLIQSKVKIIDGELEEAEELLRQAEKLAMDKGIFKLAWVIGKERDNILLKRDEWINQSEHEIGILELVEDLKLNDFFGDLFLERFNRTEIVRETPLALLVLDRRGNTRVVRSFSDKYKLREHLLGSFFSVMNIFAQDLFSSDKPIDRMKYGEYKIAFNNTSKLNFCYIYEGNSYQVDNKLSRCIKLFDHHNEVMELLEFTFTNPDLSMFPDMVSAIENIFLTSSNDGQ